MKRQKRFRRLDFVHSYLLLGNEIFKEMRLKADKT